MTYLNAGEAEETRHYNLLEGVYAVSKYMAGRHTATAIPPVSW